MADVETPSVKPEFNRIDTTKAIDETKNALRRHRMSTLIEEGQKNIRKARAVSMIKAKMPTPTPEPWVYEPKIKRSVESRLKHRNVTAVVRKVREKKLKDFSNYKKHQTVKRKEAESVRVPDPYYTMWEKNIEEFNESRKKWIGGHFVVTDHNAAVCRRERMEASDYAGLILGEYHNPEYNARGKVRREKFLDSRGWR